MDKQLREAVLMRAAVAVAEARGLRGLTVNGVARESDVPLRTVYRWCGSRKQLRMMVIAHARAGGSPRVLAEAEQLHL